MPEGLLAIPRRFFTSDGLQLSRVAYMFLLMVSLAFFTPGFVTMPPTDRDESLFAQATKQMIETNNYTDINVQNQPRYKKPIGIYWLQSLTVRALSLSHLNDIWAYRLPSLAGALVTVLMTAALGSLLFSPATGLLAGLMMAGCVVLNVEARLAKTDAMLLGCISTAKFALARAYLRTKEGWRLPLVFWSAVALGILIKGPVIMLPLLGTLLWLKISDKNLAWFSSLQPATGIIYTLAIITPWFVTIMTRSHGDFIAQSAGHDLLDKIWHGSERGMMPPGMHLMALPLVFFPYALYVVLAIPDMWRNRKDKAIKFCLGWALPTWLVFEVSLTKLPHYVLPAYPALALMTAHFMVKGLPALMAAKRHLPTTLIIGMWLVIGFCYASVFALLPMWVDGELHWLQIAASVALILAQGAALIFLTKDKIASFIVLTAGGLIFLTVTFGNTIPNLKHLWLSREIMETAARSAPCPSFDLIAAGYHEPSLIFLAGTQTVVATNGLEAAQALQGHMCRIAVVAPQFKNDFLNAFTQTPQHPIEIGAVEGLNSGHGSEAIIHLYRMPPS